MNSDTNPEQRKSLYYVPYMRLNKVHLSKPMVNIPKQLQSLGYKSALLVGENLSGMQFDFELIETGNTSHREGDRGFKTILKEIVASLKFFFTYNPDFSIVHGNYIPNSIIVFLVRISNFIHSNRTSRKYIMKLDWDGDLSHFGVIQKYRYLSFVFLGSLIFTKLTIETECGFNTLKKLPFIRQKIRLIPNTVSRDYLPTEPYDNGKREKIVLTTSVVDRYKGIHLLISAFIEASKRVEGWRLTIIGPVLDYEYYEELRNMGGEFLKSGKIEFLGEKNSESIKQYYQTASLYCTLSLKESFGIARLEAISQGLPVLTSYAGCGEKILGSMVTDISNIDETEKKLAQLMSSDTLRKDLSREGQKNIISWDELTAQFLSI